MMFFRYLSYGALLLVSPRQGWTRIGRDKYNALLLAVYTLSLAFPMFLFRALGGWLQGFSPLWAFLESLLFTLICVGTSLSIGLFLIPCARFARRPVNDGHAMRLALFSASPLWAWSFLQLIPVGFVRTLVLLLSLAHCSFLLFAGLPRLFGTEPLYTLTLALLLSGTWVLSVVLLTQVFLGMAFAL